MLCLSVSLFTYSLHVYLQDISPFVACHFTVITYLPSSLHDVTCQSYVQHFCTLCRRDLYRPKAWQKAPSTDIGVYPISGIPDIAGGYTRHRVYTDIGIISQYTDIGVTRYRVYPISGIRRYRGLRCPNKSCALNLSEKQFQTPVSIRAVFIKIRSYSGPFWATMPRTVASSLRSWNDSSQIHSFQPTLWPVSCAPGDNFTT
jgi:hypothetical protein